MTRSIKIANMSNWDGEDYVVIADGAIVNYNEKGERLTETRLKPGEATTVYPSEENKYQLTPVDAKEPVPFKMNGKQMTPVAHIAFE